MTTLSKSKTHPVINMATHIEFSKKMIVFFMSSFGAHLVILIVSALFQIGDYNTIASSFTGSLIFYATMFSGYTLKAGFENYDKYTKQHEIEVLEMVQEDLSCG